MYSSELSCSTPLQPLDLYWRQKCRSVVLEEHIARHVASVADIASRLGAGGVGVEGGGERGRGDPVTKTTHLVEDVPRKRRKSSPPADLSSGMNTNHEFVMYPTSCKLYSRTVLMCIYSDFIYLDFVYLDFIYLDFIFLDGRYISRSIFRIPMLKLEMPTLILAHIEA